MARLFGKGKVSDTVKSILRLFGRRLGYCIHPSYAIEVMHFSQKNINGQYKKEQICGYLCNICMAKVDIPICTDRGFCLKERGL